MTDRPFDLAFDKSFCIGGRPVGEGAPVYVIAEIGSNHDQNLDKAKRLIEAAARAGADAAKFQSLRFDKVHHAPSYGEEFRKFFGQIELREDWYPHLVRQCRDCGVHFMSSVTYLEAVDLLVEAGADAIKIASAQFDIFPEVIEKAARAGLPLILSTGLAECEGVDRVMRKLAAIGNRRIALMHCVTAYPAPLEAANVAMLRTYAARYGCMSGYSDHTEGDIALLAAVAIGAKVIERHITLDRSGAGPDHHFAMEMDDFSGLVRRLREVECALGDGRKRPLDEAERKQREAFYYKLTTARPLKAGERLDRDMFVFRRAPGGIPHMTFDGLRGRALRRDLPQDVVLQPEDLE